MRLARTAARDGVCTVQAARLVLFLGWWLLAGGLAASIAEGFARLTLLGLLVTWRLCRALDCQPGDLLTHDGTHGGPAGRGGP
ncbi:MAG TPA: helix-turn-helix domain-containing protein [Streptosporangiaceae bacterium]|nr:helix-turn-helix domain-containing protein [Streptosporangiaceae bacterium]